MTYGRGNGVPINCDTCFVPAYHPFGKASDKHGKAAGEAHSHRCKARLLLKAAHLEYDPLTQLPGDVVKALQAGQKIEAIKRYREVMSVGLAEAKSVVEEAQRRAGL